MIFSLNTSFRVLHFSNAYILLHYLASLNTIMSLSAPTRILRKPAVSRQFSTSRPVLASRGPSKPEGLGARSRPWSVQNVPKFAFDDATSLGWMRMFRIQEGEGLVRKIEEDREALRSTFFFLPFLLFNSNKLVDVLI